MSTYFRHLYRFLKRPRLAPTHLCLSSETVEWDLRENRKPFFFHSIRGLCVAMLMGGFLTGCITDATVDLTKAPFDASTELTDASTDSITRLTDGTSQATSDLTEPTREFLSSTTPGAWFNADGMLNPDHKKIAFVVVNFDNLQEDISRGSGEYLVSLSVLMGIPPETRDNFLQSAQRQHAFIFDESQSRPESFRRLIKTLRVTSPYS
ncbi:DUF3015 family protein [Candidatus Nitrospira allomarina]|uniref:DUF3015 family protein n=1 Tax=Candidatus Nitrospira allomarina TaxID=3020900 RepID=A0AA96G8X1_9BACT|nr:DUF3015 family protein [Candidatus Nitrospira allomarina]WNM56957.1 DUF3015 family protein [Candidatus Nitrospira allomarina]